MGVLRASVSCGHLKSQLCLLSLFSLFLPLFSWGPQSVRLEVVALPCRGAWGGTGGCSLWLCAGEGAWLALSLWLQQVKAGCNSSCNERFLPLVIFIGVGE